MKALFAALAVGLTLSSTALADTRAPVFENKPIQLAQACGWYVISGCFRSWGPANNRAGKIGAYVVNTSDAAYPNFRPGWFCAVFGPYNKSTARSKSKYIKPSYIKNAC